MNSIGAALLLLDKINTPDEIVQNIDAITIDSFYAVAGQVFDFKRMGLTLVGRGAEGMSLEEYV
jgi:hypothetical protein